MHGGDGDAATRPSMSRRTRAGWPRMSVPPLVRLLLARYAMSPACMLGTGKPPARPLQLLPNTMIEMYGVKRSVAWRASEVASCRCAQIDDRNLVSFEEATIPVLADFDLLPVRRRLPSLCPIMNGNSHCTCTHHISLSLSNTGPRRTPHRPPLGKSARRSRCTAGIGFRPPPTGA